MVTANNGPIATSYTYQPFGATTVSGSANSNSYACTGRENDGTGLYFYRARYYSPTDQRFIAQDPAEFRGSGSNLYAYILNDQTDYTDPTGLELPGVRPCAPPYVPPPFVKCMNKKTEENPAALPACLWIVGSCIGGKVACWSVPATCSALAVQLGQCANNPDQK
jgi:RHS repeat-associated protein